ncbi:MAG: polyribonucleotide nucleotidyltransferase [Candidatus Jettenia sp.]|uniref:Uncharacterized protein n=1 Tax=Candidatus Jettenia caeni TaxID=247490 RepID=I3IIG6_9BACT|nr:hypothetical protein [Candidatus Jettenia sp. AMX1]MBC6928251.1 polyribonucleotide nucleotidyltransferase [Candidatus Jettenia sp.]NUN24490.1 polyribonucleotide nucleotidyltransferase [Candidatus Jettenia caeni]KAA0249986.1 MAG: polyribonucleotide nucleotidyltransferase [Candidatus Jettenia sp. AMX1]MCE7880468.1 polyribonucleotide nucleotidyltransferase [Candidatus Jettenia sp. AMX1]MCQ3926276.1 polyribonucleotide nucleotidyltransferase [Candidatus Jettenia sp.]
MTTLNKIAKIFIVALLGFQVISCGTILYPERRNQEAGRIDVGVALMDGAWLLVGLVPGIIAFAVDFTTGAIYLPDSKSGQLDYDHIRAIRFDPETTTCTQIEGIICKETSHDIKFSDEHIRYSRVKTREELPAIFSSVRQ